MSEIWRAVIEFPAYEVSDHARVRRVGGEVLRPWLVRGIYAAVSLRKRGRTYKRLTHRLAAEAFGLLVPGSKREIDRRRGIVADRCSILRGSRPHDHSSRFKGLSFVRARRKWYACISDGRGRTRGLGFFNDEVAAAKAYDHAAFAQWGAAAYLNFR